MKITHYEFGRISVDDKDYQTDVIISSEGVQDQWWRKEGHNLAIDDLETILQARPEVIVIGCGYYGRMQVPDATKEYLSNKGIRVEIANTSEAVARFNDLQQHCAHIVAALHLTC
ncbi:Mth938-like domain-containing protein [Kaarinaea lacus]